jgi:hypothetical protein
VDYDDISFKLMVRTLSLMTYFSMNDHEGFYALADSYRHFLDVNKKVSAYNYKVTSNFINFTVKLFRGKEVPDRFDIYGFKRELISTNHIIKKHWLLEQVNEIEKAASQH